MTRRSIDLCSRTPDAWAEQAIAGFDDFLRDHANCERKACALALSMAVRHGQREAIVAPLLALAAEELDHFRQVHALMSARGLTFAPERPDEYVNRLLGLMRHGEDERFVDRMLVASLIECRSAERFALMAEHLPDPDLAAFYRGFWKGEVKHGHLFVDWVLHYADAGTVYPRLHELARAEAEIVDALPWGPRVH